VFDAVLADAGIKIVLSGIQTPRMNSIMERWVRTCRHELLDRTLIWNQRHLLHALHEFECFYNGHRPSPRFRLPAPVTPTLAIEVAPPALAGLAYLAITHGRVDAVALALGGFTTLTVIVQLRLIPVYRRLAFGPAFWSFAFPYAAVATFALHWINYGRPVGYTVWASVVLLAITAFIAALVAETTAALVRHRFLPQLQ
jgi:hypothetical protein